MYAARLAAVLVGLAGGPAVVSGQPAPVAAAPSVLTRGAVEWTAAAGVARGVAVLQSAGGQRYALPAIAWGRVLTDVRGPGWMRGRFEWVVELAPLFAEWSGGGARGAGVVPLGWRWNLEPRARLLPYLEVGGGALWTSEAVPAGTTGSNFMTHAGGGVRLVGSGGHGVIVGYRLHHISNGNRIAQNPGVNAHMLVIGWTAIRR